LLDLNVLASAVPVIKICIAQIRYKRSKKVSLLDVFRVQAYYSTAMDGQKMDFIRKQLGMTKVQFLHELGISRMHLYRCLKDGPPRLVALAVLGLWYSRKMGDILDAPEPPHRAESPVKRRRKKT
jgi:hypothetical protein